MDQSSALNILGLIVVFISKLAIVRNILASRSVLRIPSRKLVLNIEGFVPYCLTFVHEESHDFYNTALHMAETPSDKTHNFMNDTRAKKRVPGVIL